MLKLIFLLNILSPLLFGAVSELVNPGNNQIIDIGFNTKSKDNKLTVPKQWIDDITLSKKINPLIMAKSRIVEKFDCEKDYLGYENCPALESVCDTQIQKDDGLSLKVTKTQERNVSVQEVLNCSPNSYTACESKSIVQTIYFELWYDSTPIGDCDKVRVTNISPYGNPYGWRAGLNYGSLAHQIIAYAGISASQIVDQSALQNAAQYFWRNHSGSCSSGTIHGPKYIPITARININTKYECPSDYRIFGSNGNYICKKEYHYYNYICKNDHNIYDKPWIGPVKDAGYDCLGQCGQYGCICNSSVPPVNNCERGFWVCPSEPSKLCTRNTIDKTSESGIENGFKYISGSAKTFKKTIDVQKFCPDGSTLEGEKCITKGNPVCLDSGFLYMKDKNICMLKTSDGKCPTNSKLVNGICEINYFLECPAEFKQVNNSTCEAKPTCPFGYIETDNGCKIDYEYTLYSCPSDYEGPFEKGFDCKGYNKVCNSKEAPNNNCKKYVGEKDYSATITKKRPLQEHDVHSSKVLSEKEYGVKKDLYCGDNCLFNVSKIFTENNNLCFLKQNEEKACFSVKGCFFSGETATGQVKEITLDTNNSLYANNDKSKVISTNCKMNGHVGWMERFEGITSVIYKDNKLEFWDSFKDYYLGFIEFPKDMSDKDANDGFYYDPILPYELNSVGFTTIKSYKDLTFLVGENKTEQECKNVASKYNLTELLTAADSEKETLRYLTGDKYEKKSFIPDCKNLGSGYSKELNTCFELVEYKENKCSNNYLTKVSSNNTYFSEYGIWGTDPNFFELMFPVKVDRSDYYTLEFGTGGMANLSIDGNIFAFITINEQPIKKIKVFIEKGMHIFKIKASKNVLSVANFNNSGWNTNAYNYTRIGEATVGLEITAENGLVIYSTKNKVCDIKPKSSCSSGSLYKEACINTFNATCIQGTFNPVTNTCDIDKKCVLIKFGKYDFMSEFSIKNERRDDANIQYRCSPLKCENGSCETATCPAEYSPNIFPTHLNPKSTDCVNNICDGKKDFFPYCGKPAGCSKDNPLVYEDSSGNCHQLNCPAGQIMDIERKVCKKLGCPDGTVTSGEACIQK